MMTTTLLTTPADLSACAKRKIAEEEALRNRVPYQILICMGGGCIASGSERLREALARDLPVRMRRDVPWFIRPVRLGPCVRGPVLVIEPDAYVLPACLPFRRRPRSFRRISSARGPSSACSIKTPQPARSMKNWATWNFSSGRPRLFLPIADRSIRSPSKTTSAARDMPDSPRSSSP